MRRLLLIGVLLSVLGVELWTLSIRAWAGPREDLFKGAEHGNLNLVKSSLRVGVDVNQRNKGGETALTEAAGHGQVAVIPLLLKAGADINSKDSVGNTALEYAILTKHLEAIRLLLKFGADPNTNGKNGTPLIILLKSAITDPTYLEKVVRLLLRAGVKFDIKSKSKENPLYLAISWDVSENVVSLLLKAGGIPKDQGHKGNTALIQSLQILAKQGFAFAQYKLALLYQNGLGVEKDYAQAASWFKKAANQSYSPAQDNLGVLYTNGLGVKKNYIQAASWFTKAADQGYFSAQNNLGLLYENGWGVEKDYAQAASWFKKAADQGFALAQYNLGVFYEYGRGVQKDYAQAAFWYRKSADQGYASAQGNLGVFYETGRGVEKDYAQAASWLRKGANQGESYAQANLGWLYQNGWGVKKDYVQAASWYRKSADQGNAPAQGNLGVLYANGWGVKKDYARAVFWYRKAAAQGNALAQKNLAIVTRLIASNHSSNPSPTVNDRLILAAQTGNIAALKEALRSGANVDTKDKYGDTALIWASWTGHVNVIPLLLKAGADTSVRDHNGYTARDMASGNSKAEIISLLDNGIPSHSADTLANNTSSSDSHTTYSSSKAISETTPPPPPPPPSPSDSQLSQEIQQLNQQVSMLSNRLAGSGQGGASPNAPTYHSSVDRPSYHASRHSKDFALVIGVEKYPRPIHAATFADRDAQAMFAHLRALGVPVRHIKRLTDETATGNRIKGALHWLSRNVQPGSTVYVYFSGHGAPGQKGHAYLVPFDGDPSDLSDTGFSTATFYRDLERLPAKHVIVALDACFTGEGKRSILGSGIRPLVTKIREGSVPRSGKLVVLTAARSDQESGVIDSKGHGLFTYYLLKGLNGGAERGGHVTVVSLYRYLKPKVQSEASLDNRNQTPELEPGTAVKEASVRLR